MPLKSIHKEEVASEAAEKLAFENVLKGRGFSCAKLQSQKERVLYRLRKNSKRWESGGSTPVESQQNRRWL